MDSLTYLYIFGLIFILKLCMLAIYQYLRFRKARREVKEIVIQAPSPQHSYTSNCQVTYNPVFASPEGNPCNAPYPVQQYSVVGANNPAFVTENSRINYQFQPSPFGVNEPPPSYYEVAAADGTGNDAQPKPSTHSQRRNSTPS